MTNFEKLTQSPAGLGAFLRGLPILEGPWDDEFHKLKIYFCGRKRKKMGTECTAAERLEIEANYAFFRAAMEEELEIFYSAFACKNNLFPSEDKAKPRDIEELSPEEKARYMKVGLMAEGMERHTLRKAIAAGETE